LVADAIAAGHLASHLLKARHQVAAATRGLIDAVGYDDRAERSGQGNRSGIDNGIRVIIAKTEQIELLVSDALRTARLG
jgi:hypothetical protein